MNKMFRRDIDINQKVKNNKFFFKKFWIKNFEIIHNYNILLNKELQLNNNILFFFTILNLKKFNQEMSQAKLKIVPSKMFRKRFFKLTKNNVFVYILNNLTDLFYFNSLVVNQSVFLLNVFVKNKKLEATYFFFKIKKIKKIIFY